MSLDKAVLYKKENRKPYRNSASFDRSCRNHGSCPYCLANRMKYLRKLESIDELLKELEYARVV